VLGLACGSHCGKLNDQLPLSEGLVTAYAPFTFKTALVAVEETALDGNLSVTNSLCPGARLDIATGMWRPAIGTRINGFKQAVTNYS